uniref:Uncharacterized protein n=1 Tax=Craspedostauros australis TaxID=1486917 RepID=A0A7R9ZR79_9STRA|mmetsp:Transcript_6789/g.18459  ORF Transcript_6789/g.18459 Transcript_6789/m.18459 type:complete len:118 (+) Transcript_6789:249-602(+)
MDHAHCTGTPRSMHAWADTIRLLPKSHFLTLGFIRRLHTAGTAANSLKELRPPFFLCTIHYNINVNTHALHTPDSPTTCYAAQHQMQFNLAYNSNATPLSVNIIPLDDYDHHPAHSH